MRYLFWALAACIPLGLAGCPSTPVRLADLDWQPPTLSSSGCPNLTGTYQDRGVLHQVFYAGLEKTNANGSKEESPARVAVFKTPSPGGKPAAEIYAAERAFNESAILSIVHSPSHLVAKLMDEKGIVYKEITLRLDTPMIGCHNGAMILRRKTEYEKREGSSASVEYGEAEIKKLTDGTLEVTSRKRKQLRSTFTGSLTGRPTAYPTVVNHFRPASSPHGHRKRPASSTSSQLSQRSTWALAAATSSLSPPCLRLAASGTKKLVGQN